MKAEELVERHPRLYHVTTPGSWDVMRQHGLLSTESLLRRIGLPEDEVQARIGRRRPLREECQPTPLGRVVLNDNRPIHESGLASCLDDGLTVADWLRILNRRVFFWTDKKDMKKLRDARINHSDPREVLVFCTKSIVAKHAQRMEIAPFNTGSASRKPARRGHATFTPLGAMDYASWRRRRMPPKITLDRLVEVVVLDGIADVEQHLIQRIGGVHA